MAETTQGSISELVREVRERLNQQVNTQAEQLGRLEQALQEIREQHRRLEETIQTQLDVLAQFEPPPPPPPPVAAPVEAPMDKLLGSVRNLITATLPEQVLEVLTEEAEQMGVRAATFDVRGKAAWGASAHGFGSMLSEKAFHGLVVPLNQDTPFRQVYETGGHVDLTAEGLRRNRNILDKFKPDHSDAILLLPVRSAGSVSAIFYADPGGKGAPLPVDGLKILAEFAGAQLDRLMALGGGMQAEAPPEAVERPEAVEAPEPEPVEAAEASAPESPQAAPPAEPAVEPVETVEAEPVEAEPIEAPPPAAPATVEPVSPPALSGAEDSAATAPAPAPAAAGFDLSQLSEEEQKVHKDAKRFAKLLVSEIELYNKAKVSDGRKNGDIYKRLKSDIDRSRQTFEKRFGKTAAKRFDYFHEEVVRTLAANDAALLGADYPGPSTT